MDDHESLDERTKRILGYDTALQMICDNIAAGQTLVGLARFLRICEVSLRRYLRSEQHRWDAYQKAKEQRKDYFAEAAIETAKQLATTDIRQFYDDKGNLLPMAEWTHCMGAQVSSIETEEIWDGYGEERAVIGQAKKIRFWDKLKANETIGKLSGAFTEKHEHSGRLTLEQLVMQSYKTDSTKGE